MLLTSCSGDSTVPEIQNAKAEEKMNLSHGWFDDSPEERLKVARSAGQYYLLAYGSMISGLTIPGLTEEEYLLLKEGYSLEVRNVVSDDPEPVGVPEDFWSEVDAYIAKFNRLVLAEHLKSKSSR